MRQTFISHFTPSLMSSETLENIFVQREDVAQRAVSLIRDSVLGASKYHTLLVGPRGIGKTHLVSLVYHRIQAMEDLQGKLVSVWMREEEWGVASFLDFLLRIFRALPKADADAVCDRLTGLYTVSPASAERAAEDLLIEILGDRTMLLIVENLDDLFAGLGDSGQKRFRAYLQNNPRFVILATSQSLFGAVSLRSSPFYGFFRVQHLEEFDLSAAVELLTKIAQLKGDHELVAYLQTPAGRARVRAVHYLAGGNPRVYVIFAEFLTCQSLDDLVGPFMNMLDELTPYYQAKMRLLSPQQRKIVDFLVERRGAVVVKDIAQQCFITQQTASGQLRELRDKGYVQSTTVGRESFYELREVLMRLCLEVKKQRGEPIKLFVEFLRLWCTPLELKTRLDALEVDSSLDQVHLTEALRLIQETDEDPRVKACLQDCMRLRASNNVANARKAAEELVEIRGNISDYILLLLCLGQFDNLFGPDGLSVINRAIREGYRCYHLYYLKALNMSVRDRPRHAILAINHALEYEADNVEALALLGKLMIRTRRMIEALPVFEQVFSKKQGDEEIKNIIEVIHTVRSFVEKHFLDDFTGEDTDISKVSRSLSTLVILTVQNEWSLLRERAEPVFLKELNLSKGYRFAYYLALMAFKQEEEKWQNIILLITNLYKQHNCLDVLATSAIMQIQELRNEEVSQQKRQDWYAAWEQSVRGCKEFDTFLAVFRVAISYFDTRDERLLLNLPIEQRAIARRVMRINPLPTLEDGTEQ